MKHGAIETVDSLKAIIARQSDRNGELATRAAIAERRERTLELELARLRKIIKDKGIKL